jgi:hypothetical protein
MKDAAVLTANSLNKVRRHSPRFAGLFVAIVWTGMLLADCWYVFQFGSAVPRLDDWEMVSALTGNQPITFSWLWSQHNEHRTPLPRLVLLALLRVAAGDCRAVMLFNVALLGAASLVVIVAARRLRGGSSYCDAFFPLALLHWGHCDNLLWAWQIGFVLPTVLACFLLALFTQNGDDWTTARALSAVVIVLALTLCGANGLLLVPCLSLGLALIGLNLKKDQGGARQLMVVNCLAMAAILVFYFLGYRAARMPDRPAPADCFRTSLEFLSTSFGPLLYLDLDLAGYAGRRINLQPLWLILGPTMLGASLWSGWILWSVCRRQTAERARAIGLLAFLVAMFCLAAGVAWGRAGFGPGMGASKRYALLAVPLVCCLYMIIETYGTPLAQAALFGFSAAMLVPNGQTGLVYGTSLSTKMHAFEQAVREGVTIQVLADRFTRPPSVICDRRRGQERFARELAMLHEAGWGIFQKIRLDPQCLTVSIEQAATTSDGRLFRLKIPQLIHVIRVYYEKERTAVGVIGISWWKAGIDNAADRMVRQVASELPGDESDGNISLAIDEPLARFQLSQQTDGPCRLVKVELLIPK